MSRKTKKRKEIIIEVDPLADTSEVSDEEQVFLEEDEAKYRCLDCFKNFSSPFALRRHRYIHQGIKPFSCEECGFSFTQSNDLERHKRTHTGERPYACNFCEYVCANSGNLRIHKRSHTGERPYKCECGQSFSRNGHLIRHKATHDTKTYNCDECKYKSTNFDSLSLHKEKKHSIMEVFSCSICEKTFSKSNHLERHVRVHSTERTFGCDTCPHKCKDASALTKHKKIHSNVPLYKCKKCDFTCMQSNTLKKHKSTHDLSSKKAKPVVKEKQKLI